MRVMVRIMALLAIFSPSSSCIAESVDTVLVLAADVSKSVNANRWDVQRAGYAAAFRDPEVLAALRARRVAVTFMQWSSCNEQEQSVRWKVIRSDSDALSFADDLARVSRRYSGGTAIGKALLFAKRLIDAGAYKTQRTIVDISGDGIEYDDCEYGMPDVELEEARLRVLEAGIVINGLPIMIRPPIIDSHNVNISGYYESRVIGGPGSFLVTVDDGDDVEAFCRSLKRKLLRELIASR